MLFFYYSSETVISGNQNNRNWEVMRASHDTATYEKSSTLLDRVITTTNHRGRKSLALARTEMESYSVPVRGKFHWIQRATRKRCLLEGGNLKRSFQTSICLPSQDLRGGFHQCPSSQRARKSGNHWPYLLANTRITDASQHPGVGTQKENDVESSKRGPAGEMEDHPKSLE